MNVLRFPVADAFSAITLIGGKAANLNRLLHAGFTVPASMVITTEAYQDFVAENNLEDAFQDWVINPVSDADIVTQFLDSQIPDSMSESILAAYRDLGSDLVAVRSSATAEDWLEASFAGQQDSFLNVRGETAVLDAVKKCWASLWQERAAAYRSQHGIEAHQVSMAVLMQPMISATCAGVIFTQDPVNPNHETVVIEAVSGLGDALVGGQVTPDRFTVNRHNRIVEKEQIQGETAVLTSPQIHQLTDTGLAVADLFGTAQDIEWAVADEQLYLLQSRPITTRSIHIPSPPPYEIDVPGDDEWLPEEATSQPFDLWTRANFGEVLPNPVSPMTLSSLQMIGEAAQLQLSSGQKVQMARRLYGRVYANEGGMRQFAADLGLPTSFIDATWGSRRPDLPPTAGFRPWRLLYKLPQLIWQSTQTQRRSPAKEKLLPKNETDLFKQIDSWTNAFRQCDLSAMSEIELWHTIKTDWEPRRVEMYQRHTTVSAGAFLAFAPLEWITKKWGNNPQLAQILITGLTGVYAADMGPALQRIAQALCDADLEDIVLQYPPKAAWLKLQTLPEAAGVREALAQFLDEHGHRCPAEPEILLPRWTEAPEQVIALTVGYIGNTTRLDQTESQVQQAAQREIEQELGPFRRVLFRKILQHAQKQVRRRDNSRHFMAKLELPRRRLFMELGRRWREQGRLNTVEDIFFLTHADIDAVFVGSETAVTVEPLRQLAVERREAYEFWCTYPAPEALDAAGCPLPEPTLSTAQSLMGVSASGGMATGPVRIIHWPEEAARLQAGDILVTLATDPGWTPVFPLVAGLILAYGGQLSHGAIVAREYGVPAVVNVSEAMSRLKEGMIVTLDGNSGRVFW